MPVSTRLDPAVRRLAAAQAISFAGGTSAYVALTASIYASTGSANWVAAVALASFGLPGLVAPVAGALGDRHDRRRVMVVSDLLGAICFVALSVLSGPGALVAVKALAGVAAAPFLPAATAALPRVVGAAELPRATATVNSWGTVGALAGPLLGGALTAVGGAAGVFAFNAATFVASAILIAGLRGDLSPAPRQPAGHRGLGAGLRLLAGDRVLRALTAGVALVFLGIGTTLPAEVVRAGELGMGATGYGAMIGAWSGGALLGAWLAGRLMRHRRPRTLLVLGSAGVAAGFLIAAAAPWAGLLLAGLAAGGMAEGLTGVVHLVVVQRRVPDSVLSRVLAGRSAVEQLAYSLPLAYAGLAVDGLGAGGAYAIAAGLCATGAAVSARIPDIGPGS